MIPSSYQKLNEGENEVPVLVHVGLHKTGSTWLQKAILPNIPDITFDNRRAVICKAFVRPQADPFDAQSARDQVLKQHRSQTQVGLPRLHVLTEERLSGYPSAGFFDQVTIAHRIREAIPEAHLWICIREQTTMAISCYKQYVREGGRATLEEFLDPDDTFLTSPRFSLGDLAYDRMVQSYTEVFGDERVHVTPYEALMSDPRAVLGKLLTSVAGQDVDIPPVDRSTWNQSLSDRSTQILRGINRWIAAPRSPVPDVGGPLPGRRVVLKLLSELDRVRSGRLSRWHEHIGQAIAGRFNESNRRLERILGVSLDQWGYST